MASPTLPKAPSLASGEDFRVTANIDVASTPLQLRKNCVLFYTHDMEDLAKKISAHAGGNIELGKIRWKVGSACADRRCHLCWLHLR
jgi:hypothetical protein